MVVVDVVVMTLRVAVIFEVVVSGQTIFSTFGIIYGLILFKEEFQIKIKCAHLIPNQLDIVSLEQFLTHNFSCIPVIGPNKAVINNDSRIVYLVLWVQ